MDNIDVFRLSTVRLDHVKAVLVSQGLDWEKVAHCTATFSLADAIQKTDKVAYPVATLIDMVTMLGLEGEDCLALDEFPDANLLREEKHEFQKKKNEWKSLTAGRLIRFGIRFDDALLEFVSSGAFNKKIGDALYNSRRTFYGSVMDLSLAGVDEVVIIESESIAYLKVDDNLFNEEDMSAVVPTS